MIIKATTHSITIKYNRICKIKYYNFSTFVTWSDKKGLIPHLQVLRYNCFKFLSAMAHQ